MPTSYEYSFARAAFLKSRPLTLRRGAFASGEPRRHRDVLVTYCMLTAELTPANRGAFSATEEQRAVRLHLHCHSTSCWSYKLSACTDCAGLSACTVHRSSSKRSKKADKLYGKSSFFWNFTVHQNGVWPPWACRTASHRYRMFI